jgi:hypothetical protein
MKSFATSIEIEAPIDAVWQILVDLPKWSRWNSTIERTEGKVAIGAKITLFVRAAQGRAFPLRVVSLDAPQNMVWVGGMPLGLFKGTRTYQLSATSSKATLFTMREEFSGALAGLIGRSIPDMQPVFDEFAQCLRFEAERHR